MLLNYMKTQKEEELRTAHLIFNYPSTGLFCGDWGAPRCTGERLFNHLGNKEANVYTPINIQYHYIKNTEEAPGNIIPLNETAQPCNMDYEVSELEVDVGVW